MKKTEDGYLITAKQKEILDAMFDYIKQQAGNANPQNPVDKEGARKASIYLTILEATVKEFEKEN